MAAVNESTEDEKELESAEDCAQELSGSRTSSPTTSSSSSTHTSTTTNNSSSSNSVGPQRCQTLDSHQSLLNGAQPSPFVCGGVPAAPCTDDSLPSGALVNGPASHHTSEEPHVPNKDVSPWPGTDTNPEVSQPPSELQSDTWQKAEGHVLKAPSTRTSSESDGSDCGAVVGEAADDGPISRRWTRRGVKTGYVRELESSESSSDNYDDLNRGLQEKFMCFLLKGRVMGGDTEMKGSPLASPSRRKRKMYRVERMPTEEEVHNGLSSPANEDVSKEHAQSLRANLNQRLGSSRDKAAVEELILSEEDEEACFLKSGMEMGLFQCTKCNVNFKERRHLHRHLMYHSDRHNQVGQESVLRPFICKECGRSFRERATLHKHMQIHQARRERLMQEIKGLSKPQEELCCPSCPRTLVQHAQSHELEQRYYACDECDHVATSELGMEAHRRAVHSDTLFHCKNCTFRTKSANVFTKHLQLVHKQPLDHDESLNMAAENDIQPTLDQDRAQIPPPLPQKPNGWTGAGLSVRSNGTADLYVRDKGAQKACKGLSSSLIKWSFGSLANNLSPSSRRCDKPSKLSVPTERMDVTTGLPYVEEDNQGYESPVSEPTTKHLCGFDTQLATKPAHLSQACKDPWESGSLSEQALKQKSPSKRKMSVPHHNTPLLIPKREPVSPEWQGPDPDPFQDSEYDDDYNNDSIDSHDNVQEVGSDSPFSANRFIRQDFSLKEDSCDSADGSDQDDYMEGDEICTLIVKEESIESAVSEDNPELSLSDSYTSYHMSPMFETDRKSCPYCPAVFESGVGLSNHVRGHLHRLGLSYDARHMLSPEQVASQDRQPRIRRRAPSMNKRPRKEKPESQTEHTCPLCLGWFDTKTGLSNHVRGHLKRIGKSITGVSKSPLCILTELLQDENEHQKILNALQTKPHLSRPFISQKFAGSEGLFLTPTGVPVKVQQQWSSGDLCLETRKKSEELCDISETSSSTLIELLKRKRLDHDLHEVRGQSQAARTRCIVPSSRNTDLEDLSAQDLSSTCGRGEKFEINKKVCIHCNATFHSAVSLSNHLRAYARRKRLALQEGTSYDCNQKRPRSRPGPKRKEFSSPHTTSEVIYRLTCRFCDLVFQGPQSVQEDWVKHLQRHLMHTSVPGTGASMVEVTAVCEELCDPSLDTLPFPQLAQGLS